MLVGGHSSHFHRHGERKEGRGGRQLVQPRRWLPLPPAFLRFATSFLRGRSGDGTRSCGQCAQGTLSTTMAAKLKLQTCESPPLTISLQPELNTMQSKWAYMNDSSTNVDGKERPKVIRLPSLQIEAFFSMIALRQLPIPRKLPNCAWPKQDCSDVQQGITQWRRVATCGH